MDYNKQDQLYKITKNNTNLLKGHKLGMRLRQLLLKVEKNMVDRNKN